MREIKFRLIIDKKIVGYLRLKDGWTQFQAIGRKDWYFPCNFKWELAEQYWGKDCNNNDIYVNDRVVPHASSNRTDAMRGIIIFDEEEGTYRVDVGTEEFLMVRPCECEVIGTIHTETE